MHPQVYAIATLDLHTANCKTCRQAMFGVGFPVVDRLCDYGKILDKVARERTLSYFPVEIDAPANKPG